MRPSSGIALIAVMAALMVLSAIALGLAASVQTEARIDSADWDGLQAEELARSGQEFASFLEARGLRKTPDFMAGLPFEAVIPGFHYRAQAPSGVVDIYFEADSGKLDLTSAPAELLSNFFTLWTGDFAKAQVITDAIQDWRDPDNEPHPNGGEAAYYAPIGYGPRNGILGLADGPLIRGLDFDDFRLKPSQKNAAALREGLDAYITSAGRASWINPNFASELVLRSVPGLNEGEVAAILSLRADRPFEDDNDFRSRLGISSNSQALLYLNLSRGAAAVSSISRLRRGDLTRSERRVMYSFSAFNPATGIFEANAALGRLQR
jgi:general secretion pathway protein K